MSSDLLEDVDNDENGCTVSLSMNASGTAFLQIIIPTAVEYYVFTPDDKGIANAEKIANALKDWVNHTISTRSDV